MKNRGLEEKVSSTLNHVGLVRPDSRLLESQGRFFISYAPSASIIPVDHRLAGFFLDGRSYVTEELVPRLKQLLDMGIVSFGEQSQKAEVTCCVSPPVKTLIFHVNETCNLRCRHCYIEADASKKYQLDGDVVSGALKDFADMGGLVVDVTGGEPLLRLDIFDLLSTAKNSGLHTNLLSNGTNISGHTARRIKEVANRVTVSVDGLEEAHDWLRGPGVFDEVSESLDTLRGAGVPTGATTMFTYKNLDQLPEVQEFLLGKGVRYWSLVLPRRSGRLKNDDVSDRTCEQWFSDLRKYYGVLRVMKQKAKDSGMEVVIDHVMIPYKDRKNVRLDADSLNHSLYSKGRICWDNTITVLPNGDVKGCLFIDNFVYGNLGSADLKTIYTSKSRGETIEGFKAFKGEKECPIIPVCDY